MNFWGVIIVGIGAGVLYWADKHAGSLSVGNVAGTVTKAAVNQGSGSGAIGQGVEVLNPGAFVGFNILKRMGL